MIHSSSVGCRLLMTVLLLWGLLILLLGIIVSIMPRFTTVVAYIGSARCTSLHGGIVRCPLPWSLLTTLLVDSAAADVETSCVEGTGHDSSDRAVPNTSDEGHAVNKDASVCCCQSPVLAFSSFCLAPCAYCQVQ
jgi:hypothetical protein